MCSMTESYQYNLLLQIAIQRDKTAEVEMHSSIIVQYMYAIEVCNLSTTSTLDCDQSNVTLRVIFFRLFLQIRTFIRHKDRK